MILLSKGYKGYLAGTIVQLATQEEAALIAQGFGTSSAGPVTAGGYNTTANAGRVGIGAGITSVVITNPNVDANSKISAFINQAAADATLTAIARIVPAAGSFTIAGNAAATALTTVDWVMHPISGDNPPN